MSSSSRIPPPYASGSSRVSKDDIRRWLRNDHVVKIALVTCCRGESLRRLAITHWMKEVHESHWPHRPPHADQIVPNMIRRTAFLTANIPTDDIELQQRHERNKETKSLGDSVIKGNSPLPRDDD